jgi:hypothetical protein
MEESVWLIVGRAAIPTLKPHTFPGLASSLPSETVELHGVVDGGKNWMVDGSADCGSAEPRLG